MLFNSLHFVFFFAIVTTAYFALPHRYRWMLLLLSSCWFYMAFVPVYILILGFTIVVDYFAGIAIENQKQEARSRKLFLIASIIANVGVLAVFKYYDFFTQSISWTLNNAGYKNTVSTLGWLLPIGLSFHTFQAMSYTIEVYRGKQKAERHFGIYALYVMFYPQLVAGPIERPQNLIHQFYEKREFDNARIASGLRLMLRGLFKKLVVADRLAIYVNAVYSFPEMHSGVTLAVATIFFAFQIYCDFSGYSDIAIGCARVMGFNLMNNFQRPYFAASVREFWRRWHISLSTWFRDYLFIPLGGSPGHPPEVDSRSAGSTNPSTSLRVTGKLRWYMNLMIVFVVSGLWHGANFTFIIWGALHGCYILFALMTHDVREKLTMRIFPRSKTLLKVVSIVVTFVFVCFAWIFFRANNVSDAFTVASGILTWKQGVFFTGNPAGLVYSLGVIMLLVVAEYRQEYFPQKILLMNNRNIVVRYASYITIILIILLIGVLNGGQFIYFQF
jgi:D-alanyl-lipoteichoic acid acyltransferase DltB (MBOAT superfamily)